MEMMSNKALMIAVGLIITMIITSAVLFTINQITVVYKQVYETDTHIQGNFDEFDAFDSAKKTNLDFLNAIKKYRDSDSVYVVNNYNDDYFSVTETDAENTACAFKLNDDWVINDIDIDDDILNNPKEVYTKIRRLSNGKVIIIFIGYLGEYF